MLKACSRCGKIHNINYRCNVGRVYNGRRSEAEQIRYTTSWKKKAEQIKEDSNYLCAVCQDKGIYNYNALEVHHIEKLKDSPEKALYDNNLICLCKIHHRAADAGKINKSYLYKLVEGRNTGTKF